MKLFEIQEPNIDQAAQLKPADVIVGIDLGTTFSLIGSVNNDGVVELYHDVDHQSAKLPSVVSYIGDNVVVGEMYIGADINKPQDVIRSVKRFLGQHKNPQTISKKTSIEISASILSKLKSIAEVSLQKPVQKCVLTVPAYFDEGARAATKAAANVAGLEVVRMLNEPTAAAIAYGLDNKVSGTVAVYDLGGGTFDITILKMHMGVYQVIATGGDNLLGGDDFDALLVNIIKSKLSVENTNLSISESELLLEARYIKESLTENQSWQGVVAEKEMQITYAEFEEKARPLIMKTIKICKKAFVDANIMNCDIDQMILVGGASRMQLVKIMLREYIGKEPLCSIDPDLAVVQGAALQADSLQKASANLLIDVIPLSLGIEIADNGVEKIIHRNTPLPIIFTKQFTTQCDGQTAISINVVQGEAEFASECRQLARFELKGIKPMLAGQARLELTFQVDVDGLLTVMAYEKISDTKQHIEIKPAFGLTEAEIQRLIENSLNV